MYTQTHTYHAQLQSLGILLAVHGAAGRQAGDVSLSTATRTLLQQAKSTQLQDAQWHRNIGQRTPL
jgi:hypothetical protein